jgi:uncharacterized protein YjbI with pentapeptide repeats
MFNKKESIKENFKDIQFIRKKIDTEIFDECLFENCDFSETDFSKTKFIDCKFISCNFTMIKVYQAKLQNVEFIESKLLGINFIEVDQFMMVISFKSCIIRNSYFNEMKLQRTKFLECIIENCDFSYTDLEASDFSDSSLKGSIFSKCNLSNVDFRKAKDYSLNPTKNEISGAKFSFPGVLGLLEEFDIIIE